MRFKRLKRKLGFPVATAIVTLAFAALIGSSLFGVQEKPRRTKPVALEWTARPEPVAQATPESFATLRKRLDAAPGAEIPSGARERASLLHEIGRLKTRESRIFLLTVAEQRRYEIVERLAAVSALAHVGDRAALDAIAEATSDSLVQAKIRSMRQVESLHRGGDK